MFCVLSDGLCQALSLVTAQLASTSATPACYWNHVVQFPRPPSSLQLNGVKLVRTCPSQCSDITWTSDPDRSQCGTTCHVAVNFVTLRDDANNLQSSTHNITTYPVTREISIFLSVICLVQILTEREADQAGQADVLVQVILSDKNEIGLLFDYL